jgi:hypothetical protein
MRVLVKGCSTAVLTSWMGGPRTDFAYPRVVEAELLAAGIPAKVRVTADVGAQARNARRSWEGEVITWSPDVVVLHYGQYEAIHLLMPWRVERYVNDVTRRPGVRDTLHTQVVKKAYIASALVQQRIDQRLHARAGGYRFRRMPADLERLVQRIRNIASPLVLIPDQVRPGPLWARPFPGMAARVDEMNRMLHELVDRINDPDVRMFSVNDVIAAMDVEGDPTPDGGHFSPAVHREVGRALAGTIQQWAAEQPHLGRAQSLG